MGIASINLYKFLLLILTGLLFSNCLVPICGGVICLFLIQGKKNGTHWQKNVRSTCILSLLSGYFGFIQAYSAIVSFLPILFSPHFLVELELPFPYIE